MSFTLLSIGDSVVWGQGLAEVQKFRVGLQQDLQAALGASVDSVDRSHSGAVLAPNGGDADPTLANWPGEVPRFSPSVWAQWERIAHEGLVPDIVLLNGGINDVDFRTICSPWDRRPEIAGHAACFCGEAMRRFLEEQVFASGRPRVILTGYYAAISSASAFGELLDSGPIVKAFLHYIEGLHRELPFLESLGEVLSLSHLTEHTHLLSALAANWETFADRANTCLRETAHAVNEKLGETRVWFVDPAFGPEHALFTAAPYLFHPSLPPRDSAAEVRERECPLCYPATEHPFELMICLAASTGHPNAQGAQRYRERIREVALPELVKQLKEGSGVGRPITPSPPARPGQRTRRKR